MDTTAMIFRIQLGGERGRKLMLRAYFQGILDGKDESAFKLLNAIVPNMPQADKEYVLAVVSAFTSALAYEDPDD